MWPKTILLLPVWPRDAKRLDTPDTGYTGVAGTPNSRCFCNKEPLSKPQHKWSTPKGLL